MTHTSQWTTFAVLCSIHTHKTPIPSIAYSGFIPYFFHVLTHRAYIIISLAVIIKIVLQERILKKAFLLFFMEHRVFDKCSYTFLFTICIVLFAAITGICRYLITVCLIPPFKSIFIGCKGEIIC